MLLMYSSRTAAARDAGPTEETPGSVRAKDSASSAEPLLLTRRNSPQQPRGRLGDPPLTMEVGHACDSIFFFIGRGACSCLLIDYALTIGSSFPKPVKRFVQTALMVVAAVPGLVGLVWLRIYLYIQSPR